MSVSWVQFGQLKKTTKFLWSYGTLSTTCVLQCKTTKKQHWIHLSSLENTAYFYITTRKHQVGKLLAIFRTLAISVLSLAC